MRDSFHVLVVEDNADQALLTGAALRRHTPPMEMTLVRNARECLQILGESSYSAILLDHHLPGTSGLELLRAIQTRCASAPPVLMVTGHGDERVAVDAMKAGAADYVIKSSGYLTSLPGAIAKVVKQHTLAQENVRLDREARRRLRETEGLLAVTQALMTSLDPDELARRTTRELGMLLDAETVAFLALDQASATLRLSVGRGTAGKLADLEIALPSADLHAFRTEVNVPDELSATARVCVPVATSDRWFGVLLVRWSTETAALIDEGERLARGVANQMALALENARFYQETQDALAEVERAQERLVQGNTLRALGEMAAGTAHHLNNLLAIALGRLQLMRRRLEPGAPVIPTVDIIEQALADAASVVRRMQRFARTGPTDDDSEAVDLEQIAHDVREMTDTQCVATRQALGIPIVVRVDLNQVPPVRGSASALRETVTNLVLNALDAMPRGGTITLRTFQDSAGVCLAVSDTGVGMPPEVKQRALEPFFTTKGPKGTGLGLSVAYGVMRRHGGDLELESSEGRGTTVTLRLPATRPAVNGSGHPPADPETVSDSLRVLIVDDDERVRVMLADVLGAEGHCVLQASTGREALSVLERGVRIDLVLTDHAMPEMTGLELIRAVKPRWPQLRVGLLTGFRDIEGLADGPEPEFVLAKPVDSSLLRAAVAGKLAEAVTSSSLSIV